jgi:hypothetical protein
MIPAGASFVQLRATPVDPATRPQQIECDVAERTLSSHQVPEADPPIGVKRYYLAV